jgi:hypothetical protein
MRILNHLVPELGQDSYALNKRTRSAAILLEIPKLA